MGRIINNRTLTAKNLLELPYPVLLCMRRQDLENTISDAGFQNASLNLPLAKAFVGKQQNEIATGITATVLGLLPKNASLYLSDYEMLFNPHYRIDVIKLFCEISRFNQLIVKWCGGFANDTLTYAEQGYDDYVKYTISNYDITCVV
ncbi:MAG: hypothetical protein LBI54_06570 [Lachnospiraceae bacterium]|jgi:hypothetical protein|nr:hypothetical protein [Lachnospiraceae bacterium]